MPRALPRFRTVAQITLLTLVTMAAGSVLAASPPPEKLRETLAVEGGLAIEGRTLDRESLRRFYEPRQHLAAWQGDQAVLDRAQLIAALQAAPAHGLDPSDYHV